MLATVQHSHNLPCVNWPACLMRVVASCMQDHMMGMQASTNMLNELRLGAQRAVNHNTVTSQVEA